MTKRRVERLLEQAKENGQGGTDEDDPEEVAVELAGVPARGPEEDGPRPAAAGESFEAFRVDLNSGEVETGPPDPGDLPDCATPGCPNPSLPVGGESVCEVCMDMPRRDWRPVVVENEEGDGGDHE